MNKSKINDKRFWNLWETSGAIGTPEDAKINSIPGSNFYEKAANVDPGRGVLWNAVDMYSQQKNIERFLKDCIKHYSLNAEAQEIRDKPAKAVALNLGYILTMTKSSQDSSWAKEFHKLQLGYDQ